jgi:hypothetical protein
MPRPRKVTRRFTPRTIEDVFALYLARELGDVERVRWYAKLAERYSLCLLLNALRRARKLQRIEGISPEAFLRALSDILTEGKRL